MKFQINTFSLDDIAALAIVIGCLVLIGCGQDGEVKAILGTAAGWLFGKRVTTGSSGSSSSSGSSETGGSSSGS